MDMKMPPKEVTAPPMARVMYLVRFTLMPTLAAAFLILAHGPDTKAQRGLEDQDVDEDGQDEGHIGQDVVSGEHLAQQGMSLIRECRCWETPGWAGTWKRLLAAHQVHQEHGCRRRMGYSGRYR